MDMAIVVNDLHKSYKDKAAVKGVSFSIAHGEIFGIVGPNGAGKTTTLEIMEGLRKRSAGEVRVLDYDPEKDGRSLRQRIGIQFQSTSIQERLKVGEALDLFASFYERKGDRAALIETLGLAQYLNTQFSKLSGGWKQRLTLALAALHGPDILFLDEPSTGLDPQARRDIWALIQQFRAQGMTIVLTTHYMEEAERLCDRVAMFRDGAIAALDTPKRLVSQFAAAKCLTFTSAEADLSVICALPSVERAHRDGEAVWVYAPDLQEVSRRLFAIAHERQWTMEAFRFEVGSLDDLFVNLGLEGETV